MFSRLHKERFRSCVHAYIPCVDAASYRSLHFRVCIFIRAQMRQECGQDKTRPCACSMYEDAGSSYTCLSSLVLNWWECPCVHVDTHAHRVEYPSATWNFMFTGIQARAPIHTQHISQQNYDKQFSLRITVAQVLLSLSEDLIDTGTCFLITWKTTEGPNTGRHLTNSL